MGENSTLKYPFFQLKPKESALQNLQKYLLILYIKIIKSVREKISPALTSAPYNFPIKNIRLASRHKYLIVWSR